MMGDTNMTKEDAMLFNASVKSGTKNAEDTR
jgi:hypothetical protein